MRVDGEIRVSDSISLGEIVVHEEGDLTGYITFDVYVDGYRLDGLFRIEDVKNGPAMEVVSIDYGYRHPQVKNHWSAIESKLTEFAKY